MKNKKTYILLAIVFVALAGLLVVLEKTHTTNFIKLKKPPTATQQGPTPEQQKELTDADNSTKKAFIEGGGDTSTQPQSAPTSNDIGITARQETNGTVTVITKLTNYSSGTCQLVITNGGSTTSQEAPVMYQPEFSTCAGFSVPVSKVGTGTWSIKLTVVSNGATTSNSTSLGVK